MSETGELNNLASSKCSIFKKFVLLWGLTLLATLAFEIYCCTRLHQSVGTPAFIFRLCTAGLIGVIISFGILIQICCLKHFRKAALASAVCAAAVTAISILNVVADYVIVNPAIDMAIAGVHGFTVLLCCWFISRPNTSPPMAGVVEENEVADVFAVFGPFLNKSPSDPPSEVSVSIYNEETNRSSGCTIRSPPHSKHTSFSQQDASTEIILDRSRLPRISEHHRAPSPPVEEEDEEAFCVQYQSNSQLNSQSNIQIEPQLESQVESQLESQPCLNATVSVVCEQYCGVEELGEKG